MRLIIAAISFIVTLSVIFVLDKFPQNKTDQQLAQILNSPATTATPLSSEQTTIPEITLKPAQIKTTTSPPSVTATPVKTTTPRPSVIATPARTTVSTAATTPIIATGTLIPQSTPTHLPITEQTPMPTEVILTPTPTPIATPAPQQSQKININTADLEELDKITGVGPIIAQRIIDYRSTDGLFQKIEDIKKVKGIGDVTFEKMKDQITVGD